jgi:acetylornithine deacetylase/succinyl-diaminopimelate desuccinylase-like protein
MNYAIPAFGNAIGAPSISPALQKENPHKVHFGLKQDELQASALYNRFEKFFLDLVGIASPTGHEERIRDYYSNQLKILGVQYHPKVSPQDMKKFKDGAHFTTDKTGNILVYIPGNMNAESKPNLVVSAHLDTVSPALDGIKPIIIDEKNGDRTYHAPPGSILGADDKGPLAAFLVDIGLTLKDKKPRPDKTYLITVMEEPDLKGSYAMDPAWYNDAHLLLTFDNIDPPGKLFYNQAPARTELQLKVLPNNPANSKKFSIKNTLTKILKPTKTFQISGEGKSAHLSAYANGESAVLAVSKGIQNFLESSPKVSANIHQFYGGEVVNAVPKNANVTIQLQGRRKDLKKAEQTLKQSLSQLPMTFPQSQTSFQAIKKPKGDARYSANAVLCETLQNIPVGLQPENAVVNVGMIRDLDNNGVLARLDIRAAKQETVSALINQIQNRFNEAGQKYAGLKTVVETDWELPNYWTSPDHPSVKQAFQVSSQIFDAAPIFQSAKGTGDTHNYAKQDSTVFNGKVPAIELGAGWHNGHVPGDKKGPGIGEWASRKEMVDIVKLLQALSKDIAEQPTRPENA